MLTKTQKAETRRLLEKYKDIFSDFPGHINLDYGYWLVGFGQLLHQK